LEPCLFHLILWSLFPYISCKGCNFFLLNGWMLLPCVFIQYLLYPCTCCWVPRLIRYVTYYE
jgi:hypothetical protein